MIEVNGPDAVLIIFDVGGNVHDKIIGAHVAQQADEAAFVEFYKLFGEPDLIGLGIIEEAADEHVARDSRDMFFHQGVVMGEERDAVG